MGTKNLCILFKIILFSFTISGIFGTAIGQSNLSQLETPTDIDPLQVSGELKPQNIQPLQGGQLHLNLNLPEGFHAYEDQFKLVILEPDGFQIGKLNIEPLVQWYDKFSKKNRTGIKNTAKIWAHLEAPHRFDGNRKSIKIALTYQACSEKFCLFPTEKIIDIPAQIQSSNNLADTSNDLKNIYKSTEPINRNLSQNITFLSMSDLQDWQKQYGVWIFALIFLAGVLTSFTPCIFPMIPITISILGHNAEQRSRRQNFLLSLVYVLGIAATYSVLGVVAASTGQLFGALLGNTLFVSALCILFLLMALSQMGLFDLQLPHFLTQYIPQAKKGGYKNAFMAGLFAGLIASPCVGPVLVAILTFVAQTQSLFLGFMYLFIYALGLGLIFIVIGLSTEILKWLPRSGSWMVQFKKVLGFIMLIPFYYYLHLLLSERWFDVALGLGLILGASFWGAFQWGPGRKKSQQILQGLMGSIFFIGCIYVAFGIFDFRAVFLKKYTLQESIVKKLPWQTYSEEKLKQAQLEKKAVLLDFWAEWCAACLEMEQKTFSDPRVHAAVQDIVLIKFDATKDSILLKELRQRYKIVGLPTLIFIDPTGKVLENFTLTAFEDVDDFLLRLEKFKKEKL